MDTASRTGWIVRGALAVVLAVVAVQVGMGQLEQQQRSERARLVTAVSSVPTYCPDDKAPFQVTTRNLTSRTVLAATITMFESWPPPGVLPSEVATVTLKAPLPPGQAVSDCHALNRYRLIGRGVDPRSVQFSPMPRDVVFE